MRSILLFALAQSATVVVRREGELLLLPTLDELKVRGAELAAQMQTQAKESMPTKAELEQYAADAQAAMEQAAKDVEEAVPKDKAEAQQKLADEQAAKDVEEAVPK